MLKMRFMKYMLVLLGIIGVISFEGPIWAKIFVSIWVWLISTSVVDLYVLASLAKGCHFKTQGRFKML